MPEDGEVRNIFHRSPMEKELCPFSSETRLVFQNRNRYANDLMCQFRQRLLFFAVIFSVVAIATSVCAAHSITFVSSTETCPSPEAFQTALREIFPDLTIAAAERDGAVRVELS